MTRRPTQVLGRLYAEFHAVNEGHFGGLLPAVRIDLTRLTKRVRGKRQIARTVATDDGRPLFIALDDRYVLTASWSDVAATLRHEIVHVWQACRGYDLNHGPTFRDKAVTLGITAAAVD